MENFEKATSFMMVPFYYEGDNLSVSSLWQLDNDREGYHEESDYLYTHIMHFLKGNLTEQSVKEDAIIIYKLDEQKESYKYFWKKFASKTHVAKIDEQTSIDFKFTSGTKTPIFKTPHLFISIEGNVGVLVFCIEPVKTKSIQQLELLNYHLHKIQEPLCECTSKGMKLNDGIPEEAHNKVISELNIAYKAFYEREMTSSEMANDFKWNMKLLVNYLLRDMKGRKEGTLNCGDSPIYLFSPPRIHIFTFCAIDDSEQNNVSQDDVVPDLLKLSRCINNKYMLDVEQLAADNSYIKTFDNIYMAVSVEGTAMMAIARKENKGFILSMDQALERYLWVYILSIVQRYSLLNLDRRISQMNEGDNSNLLSVMKVIGTLKSHCSYAEISPFAQHNQFYKFCCNKLNVTHSYEEVEQKTNILNLLLEQRAEKGQRKLNLLVGILTLFQVAEVIFTFTNKKCNDDIFPSIITLAIGGFIICLIYYKSVFSFFKSK